jgi:hypothetical protein
VIVLCIVFYNSFYPKYDHDKVWIKEYIAGEEGIKGDVDISLLGVNPAYEIGANKEGYAVFKNPEHAFNQMKKDFSKGIKGIQKEYKLNSLSRWNFKQYGKYGWQLTKADDQETISQAGKVTAFIDIYENSFK